MLPIISSEASFFKVLPCKTASASSPIYASWVISILVYLPLGIGNLTLASMVSASPLLALCLI
ncbi:Uncharacterised protein [uncultured archaeon]|nr:Uncharacterised protein [uncultured archaeon]